MDAEALRAVVAEAITQALAATAAGRAGGSGAGGSGAGGGGAASNIHKFYTRLEKFDGEGWKE